MPAEDRFRQPIVNKLAKRAANRCSNPGCGALTSGPAADPEKSVNVGEAAHIYGANEGSARYDPAMISADRSAITNAIWLCGNCHKMVDDDEARYPAGLLFEWQREHEAMVASMIGKAGAELRHRYEKRHLEEFGRLSYLAERIIVEKDELWEYHLTGEVLRFEMAPILRRWEALTKGYYAKPVNRLSARDFPRFLSDRMAEISGLSEAFIGLINEEFQRSWCEPGVPGDDALIVSTCRLYAEMCEGALEWEEKVRFVRSHEAYIDVIALLKGTSGMLIDEAQKLPQFIADNFGSGTPSGTISLSMVLTLPDQWGDDVERALSTAQDIVIAGIEAGEL